MVNHGGRNFITVWPWSCILAMVYHGRPWFVNWLYHGIWWSTMNYHGRPSKTVKNRGDHGRPWSSFRLGVQLFSTFGFAYTIRRFSHDATHLVLNPEDSAFILLSLLPCFNYLNLSRNVIKPDFCICKNKDADQLSDNREADQCLCFCYTDST